jgi:hypothetical protein
VIPWHSPWFFYHDVSFQSKWGIVTLTASGWSTEMNLFIVLWSCVNALDMCYFPLAEARKKRKMLGAWWNQGVTGWCRLYGHVFVVAHRSLTVSNLRSGSILQIIAWHNP